MRDRALLLRMEDTRRDEPALLDSLLASPSPRTRASAALTAGRLGGTRHVTTLRALAGEGDTLVAPDALFALAMLRDTGSVRIAAAALRAAPASAVQGAWLLGEMGDAGRAALVSGLADSAVGPRARGALLLAAARLRPAPVASVVPWLASPDTTLAWRAAYVLGRARSAAAVRPLADIAASSAQAAVREQASRGLVRNLVGDSLASASLQALARLAADSDWRVRVNAVHAIATYGARGRGAVRAALGDPVAGVRLAAAQSLPQVLDRDLGAWRAAMDADTSFTVQRAVAEGAVQQGFRELVPAKWYDGDDWRMRAAVVELEAFGPASAALVRSREALLTARDGRVRAAAAAAVARLADSVTTRADARDALRRALRDADVQVRTAALGGLSSGATSDDLLAAIDAYIRSLADHDSDARLAFWPLADSALRATPTAADSVLRRLSALPRPADPLERAVAAHIPRFAAWRDDTSPARELAWYEARAREALSPVMPRAVVETERGTLELALYGSDAPLTVYNFTSLARAGYFDGQRFHRVVPDFVVQGGDPRGDGNGGPGYAIRDEINPRRYLRGTLGMALSGPNTGGSQFFVTHSPQPHLDGGYTVFGELRSGGDVLDRIVQGDRIVRVTIH